MLVNCAAYQNGRKLADVAIDNINAYLDLPDCFVWVALNEPGTEELQQMMDRFGLHELAVEDARDGHQRPKIPKIEEYGDSIFTVLHTVELERDGELATGQGQYLRGRQLRVVGAQPDEPRLPGRPGALRCANPNYSRMARHS